MSAKFIGPQFSIGIGKESSRGTAVAATQWLPWTSLSVDDKITQVKDPSAFGVVEQGLGAEIATFTSEAQLEGLILDQSFGLILKALMGTESKTTVAGESAVYDHAFTVAQSAQHPSLSLSVYGPNESSGLVYPLAMLDTLDLTFELGKYAMYKATFKANKSSSQSNTVSFASENRFRPQDGSFGYATDLAGLASPTTVQIKKLTLSFKKNTEDDDVLGNQSPVDRLNKGFECTGTVELYYSDRTFIDTIMLGDLYKAIQIVMANTDVTIGTGSHPTFTFNAAKVKLEEVARKFSAKDITMQTLKFTCFYSAGDTEMVDITLRNTASSAY